MGLPFVTDKFMLGKCHIDNSGLSNQLLSKQITFFANSGGQTYLHDMLFVKTDIGLADITMLILDGQRANNQRNGHHVLKADQPFSQQPCNPGDSNRNT